MTNFFNKLPSNFFRIPESRLFTQSATGDVYYFLLDMSYRKDTPFFNNKSHVPSAAMADNYKRGYVSCFTTVKEIMAYRNYSRNTVKEALRNLKRLGLIKFEREYGPEEEPWADRGMIYRVGVRLRDKESGKLTHETESYLDMVDKNCGHLEGAQRVQRILIDVLGKGQESSTILNIRFDEVDGKAASKTKQPKKQHNRKSRKATEDDEDDAEFTAREVTRLIRGFNEKPQRRKTI